MTHINIPFNYQNVDRYLVRTSILSAIDDFKLQFKGDLLDIGCGKMPYKEYLLQNSKISRYVGMDIDNALVYDEDIKPDYTWDGFEMPFEDSLYDTIIATEVLEHCPYPNITLKETYRVLRPGGLFFFTVPFLWNLHEIPHDEFRYTPFALQRLLEEAGFTDIKIKATGGWNASLAQMIGLWLKRGPYKKYSKTMYRILKPILKFLIKKDTPPRDFSKPVMIPGLYGTAIKKAS